MKPSFFLILVVLPYSLCGQRQYQNVNPNLEFGKKLAYQIDFRQKHNAPFFMQGYELPRYLIKAVRDRALVAYSSSSLDTVLDLKTFNKRLKVPYLESSELIEDETDTVRLKARAKDDPIYYLFKQLYILEFEELYYFDRRYSQFKRQFLSLSILIPAAVNPFGIDKVLATFKYEDAIKILKSILDKSWRNFQNDQEHINIGEAFESKFFTARLIRYEDPKLGVWIDMYEGKDKLVLSERVVLKLIERELKYGRY